MADEVFKTPEERLEELSDSIIASMLKCDDVSITNRKALYGQFTPVVFKNENYIIYLVFYSFKDKGITPDEDFIKEIDALLTKYYNGTATEEEKAIVKARTEAAKAKVEKEFNPYMFDPMFCGPMSSPMNPFAFC